MRAQGNISTGSVLCGACHFYRAQPPLKISPRTVWQDYLALFRALHPECDALPLSRVQVSLSLTHTLSHSRSRARSLALALARSLIHTHSLTCTLARSLIHTQTEYRACSTAACSRSPRGSRRSWSSSSSSSRRPAAPGGPRSSRGPARYFNTRIY